MERDELHSRLKGKLEECWNTYREDLLRLSPDQIIDKAEEIAAARFCYDDLRKNAASYPAHYLEHLLEYDDPLEAMREQWMEEHCFEYSDDMDHVLWSLWDHVPCQDMSPDMGGIS